MSADWIAFAVIYVLVGYGIVLFMLLNAAGEWHGAGSGWFWFNSTVFVVFWAPIFLAILIAIPVLRIRTAIKKEPDNAS